ncbi:DUF2188 domain-containing protein [Aquibacillus halophilus]|uniref:DUF2188 domain-containing protein n=1 Tax=Aquibacillus halophilus TaxID=930132 RepID=A0A6A8D6Z4_9BACI|nr:DUF2188 domain-containing protein [Aquibacillus halophilus]MRH41384.1 DUF2188 domain-containing protein [Aquibacillus halophilus]
MVWTLNDYPESMKNLKEATREKAIDIANALINEEGYEEGRAIAIAIAQAKKWIDEDQSSTQHVVPHPRGWAVKAENSDKASNVFNTKKEALARGQELASTNNTLLVIHRQDGTIEEQQNYA